MIRKPTVLVLGAGASTHLGYPIGKNLLNEVCSHCVALTCAKKITELHTSQYIRAFGKELARSGFGSVDAFLEQPQNQEFLDVGKRLMADCLKQYEIGDRPFAPYDPGWYQYLFSQMAGKTPDDFRENQVTVVTFNYDRSLEYYLHESIIYRYKLKEARALELLRSIPIIHVHGILGEYPTFPYSHGDREDVIEAIAAQIKIVHEIDDSKDDFCSEDFKRAHDALVQSENIFFLGFGFNEDNVRRFRFFEPGIADGRNILAATGQLFTAERTELVKELAKYGLSSGVLTGNQCSIFFRHDTRLD